MKRFITLVSLGAAAIVCAAGSVSATEPLYFLNHNNLPASGSVATWDGATAMTSWQGDGVPAAGPTVEVINGQKWSKNYCTNNVGEPWNPAVGGTWGKQTGYRLAEPTTAIDISGATFVIAAKRGDAMPEGNWRSIIDVMYDKLVLGINSNTGQIIVRRNGQMLVSAADKTLAVGEAAVLSMTTNADGSFEVWKDGVSMLTGGANGDMESWDPNRMTLRDEPDWVASGVPGGNWDAWKAAMTTQFGFDPAKDFWGQWWGPGLTAEQRAPYWGYEAPVEPFKKFINVGRNNPDGWTAFNGSIGDVKIYGVALSEQERLAQVAAVSQSMGLSPVPEPGTLLALGALLAPAGMMLRRRVK